MSSMSMPALALVIIAAGAACGPKQGPNGGGGGSGSGAGSGSGTGGGSGAGTGDGSGSSGSEAPLSRADCERMIDHVLEIGMAEQRAQKPAEYVPTPEQVTQIRTRLAAEQLEPCLAWPRPVWECTIAATTVTALYHCAEGPEP